MYVIHMKIRNDVRVCIYTVCVIWCVLIFGVSNWETRPEWAYRSALFGAWLTFFGVDLHNTQPPILKLRNIIRVWVNIWCITPRGVCTRKICVYMYMYIFCTHTIYIYIYVYLYKWDVLTLMKISREVLVFKYMGWMKIHLPSWR